MARHKDTNWNLTESASTDHAQLAVMMDIRDELKALNRTFNCANFQSIPRTLSRLDRRVARFSPLKKRRRKK
jgi:hypothetical protein